jgi:uncharacterized membrane protein YphA (DoxX/SURF4 family)
MLVHDFSRTPFALIAFSISSVVFWPYFAGAAILIVGLVRVPKNSVRQAHGLEKLIPFGPVCFGIAMAIFGADHLTSAKFVATIVPSWIPGHLFWAYFVGFALIAAALSLAAGIQWRLAAALLAIMIFLFVLLIHIPNYFAAPGDKVRLTILLRDLALSGGALALAASPTQQGQAGGAGASRLETLRPWLVTVARVFVALPIAVFGVDHFLYPTAAPGIPQENTELLITMPAWIPGHIFWAYLVGATFLVCAVGLMTRKRARFAATVLGFTVLLLVLFVYIPLTIAKPSDIVSGLNYLAIHFALAGVALFLAAALPARSVTHP